MLGPVTVTDSVTEIGLFSQLVQPSEVERGRERERERDREGGRERGRGREGERKLLPGPVSDAQTPGSETPDHDKAEAEWSSEG